MQLCLRDWACNINHRVRTTLFQLAAGQLKVYQFAVSQGDHIVSATESLTLPLPGYVLSSAASPSKKGAKASSETDSKIQRTDSIALGDNYLAVAGNHKTGGIAEYITGSLSQK